MKTTHIYTDKILTQEDIINYIDEVKDDVTLYEKIVHRHFIYDG